MKYFEGDLLQSGLQHIAHGCNMNGGFGSGVAKAVATKYPKARGDYWLNFGGKPGGTIIESLQDDGVTIYNCLTQEWYGPGDKKYVDYNFVAKVFKEFNNILPKGAILGIPKIGAGLAGGDWEIIEKIIDDEAKNYEVHCYIL